eukprot:COSAG02_NODE_14927_length_1222_cov_26.889581_1_plen_98_part_01
MCFRPGLAVEVVEWLGEWLGELRRRRRAALTDGVFFTPRELERGQCHRRRLVAARGSGGRGQARSRGSGAQSGLERIGVAGWRAGRQAGLAPARCVCV